MAVPCVALVNRAPVLLNDSDLDHVARALQIQVERDFAPVWGTPAQVVAAPGRRAPKGSWPIYVVPQPQAGLGVHVDHNGHPFAEVKAEDDWTITASHELLEMLASPRGSRFTEGPSIVPGAEGRRVRYLVEVCDPVQLFHYTVDRVRVSDFAMPDFYRAGARTGAAFDFLRTLAHALQVGPGCCQSWHDPADGHWHQLRPDGILSRSRRPADPAADSPRDDRDQAFGQEDDHHDLSAIRRRPA